MALFCIRRIWTRDICHEEQSNKCFIFWHPRSEVKFILFLLTGLMAGVAAICLTSRLGSTRPSIAFGWELEVVTMVVLGGVNILGGSGSIPGVFIAAFVMGLVTFGLGLLNVPGL